ncbi:MAG: ABC transporter ATP-binding protein [Archangium sp.]
MIELRNITKRFGGVAALEDVSLEVKPGERLALIGENGAGKSSLMNVLYGLYQPDQGEVVFDGQKVVVKTPAEALARGVGMVHQHFTLVPTLTVTENVVLGHEPTRGGFRLDLERARKEVDATCAKFGFQLDTGAVVRTLSVGSQQKVEIVKALHRGVKTLILDEPTAVLTPQEADELFAVTRKLSEEGLAVVLISHKLKEVFAFSTRIAVMRRGKKVAEVDPKTSSPDAVAALMVGTEVKAVTASVGAHAVGAKTLQLDAVSADGLKNISLCLNAGEILGIAGVDGNGQRELAELLTGLRAWKSGSLSFEGKAFATSQWTPRVARELGVSHIPEDRLRRAIISDLSVEENASLGRHRSAPFASGMRVDFEARRSHTAKLLEAHDVRPREPELRAGGLSGGNQQKLVVGRELESSPKVVVVVQPTRGLDIAAVAAVRERLIEQRNRGCAVLLVSLDLDEVLELSDRVLVMYGGALNGEFARGAYDERVLGQHMLGVAHA